MKLSRKLLLPVALLASSSALKAQTIKKEVREADFMVFNSANTNSWRGFNGISSTEGYGDKALTSVVIPVEKGLIATLGGKGIIALDENANIKWNCDVSGIPMHLAKFKNKLIAFTVPDIQKNTGVYANELNAFLIDPLNGKILLQKNINSGDATFIEQAIFFSSADGSFSKVGIRLSNRKKAIDLTLINKWLQQFVQTQSFTLFDLDEKLEKSNSTNLTLPEGGFGGAQCNSKGEIFVRTIPSQNSIQISKYVSGNPKPVKTLAQAIDARKKDLNTKFLVSKNNPEIVYVASLYEDASKETALVLSSLNFTDGKVKDQKELITKAYLKSLEKNYVSVNSKVDNIDLGSADKMSLFELEEHGDQLFASLSSMVGIISPNMAYDDSYSILLKAYDLSLSPKSQNIIPRFYNSPYGYGLGLHRQGNTLHFIANDRAKALSNRAVYGELDLTTGQVVKLNHLEKDKIEKGNPVDPATVLWYPSGFVLSYMNLKGIAGKIGAADIQVFSYK